MNLRRCSLSWLVFATAWLALPAWPQQPARLPKVAILSPARQADMGCLPNNQGGGAGCLLEGLRALGYSDGRNVVFEYRFAEGAAERLPALAAELVALRPDVIYTYTTVGATPPPRPRRRSRSLSGRQGKARWSGWQGCSRRGSMWNCNAIRMRAVP